MSKMIQVAVDGNTLAYSGTCTLESITLTNVGADATMFILYDLNDVADIVAGDNVLFTGNVPGNTTIQFQFAGVLASTGLVVAYTWGGGSSSIAMLEMN